MEKENNYPTYPGLLNPRWLFFTLLVFYPYYSYSQGEIIKTYYDESHNVIKEYYRVKDLKSRIIDGEYRSYYVNGQPNVIGSYINNIPDGMWTYYYENGNIKMRGRLRGSTSLGLWRYYYENGKPSMEGELKNSIKEGKWKFFYESGLIKSEGEFTHDEKKGIWNYYYEDGSIKAQAFYRGKLGIYKEFYNSGSVKMRGYQLDGKSDSLWVYYFENGKVQAQGAYLNGMKEGPWTLYNEAGQKTSEGIYIHGEKNGKWSYYYDNGSVSSEGEEKNGEKEGYWKLYNPQGQIVGDETFKSGSGEYIEYYSNGNVKVKGKIVNGKSEGKWQYFLEDGTLEGECDFTQGEGTYTGYYSTGKLKMKGMIRDGKNVGDWELFEENGTLTGYYKPVYEDDKPVFKVIDKRPVEDTTVQDKIKPQYYYRNRKSHYFTSVINEYRGFIMASNPFGTIIGSLPVSLEYYNQERLGHEIQINILRNPFFGSNESVEPNTLYKRGFDIAIRQKLYSKDNGYGMFYIANEIRYSSLVHSINAVDSSSLPLTRTEKINAAEQKYEYSFIIGNRWMQLLGEWMIREKKQKGITLDVFFGIGIGYRKFEKKYAENPYYNEVFNDLRQGKFSFSPRFGLNLGYVF